MDNDIQFRFPHQKLDAYRVAKQLCEAIVAAKIAHAVLRDQAERASVSVLQLSEGLPSDSVPMRRKCFGGAKRELYECVGAIDLAASLGAMRAEHAATAQRLAWSLRGMLIALMR